MENGDLSVIFLTVALSITSITMLVACLCCRKKVQRFVINQSISAKKSSINHNIIDSIYFNNIVIPVFRVFLQQ